MQNINIFYLDKLTTPRDFRGSNFIDSRNPKAVFLILSQMLNNNSAFSNLIVFVIHNPFLLSLGPEI